MNKFKIGIVGVAAIASLVVIGAYFHVRMREKDETLVEQTDRIARLEAENERLSNLVVNAKTDVLEPSEPSRELLRLRGEVGVLRQQTNELSAQDQFIVRQNQAADATRALLHALMTYATNHNGQFLPTSTNSSRLATSKPPTFRAISARAISSTCRVPGQTQGSPGPLSDCACPLPSPQAER